MASPSLASPSQLLEQLAKSSAGAGEPPLEELLGSVQRRQGGAAAAQPPADRLEVFPEPGFVVKTANEQGQKVFINVCGSAKMPLPPGWARGGAVPPEVKAHLGQALGGDAPPSMRFPLSMGAARIETDHRGEACLVLDCILTADLLAACASYRPLKIFLIQLALGQAQQTTGLELDFQYRLPKMRYKGEGGPPPQLIRLDPALSTSPAAGHISSASGDGAHAGSGTGAGSSGGMGAGRSGPALISEVPVGGAEGPGSEDEPTFALLATKRQQRLPVRPQATAAAAAAVAAQPQPQQQQQQGGQGATPAAPAQQQQQLGKERLVLQPQVTFEGVPASAVCITVPLPSAAAAAAQRDPGSLQVSVCADTVQVHAPGCQPVGVSLPFAVSVTGGSAVLAPAGTPGSTKFEASLMLRLPYRPYGNVLAELQQAAVAAGGQRGGVAELGQAGLMALD